MLDYLILTTSIFIIGLVVMLTKNNFLLFLISLELLFLAANLNFILFSIVLDSLLGQIMSLFLLTIAAAESAIGLAILLSFYRLRGSISVYLANLKG